jgi:arylsulfatase A-like enzyme
MDRERFTDEAISWMKENRDKKFFLFMNYLHPHIPYTPPKRLIRNNNYKGVIDGSMEQSRAIRNGKLVVSKEDTDYMESLYEAEISYSDEQIKKLYEYLDNSQALDNTIFLITSDHGENLFEHSKFYAHGNELYESTVHIPLVVSHPESRNSPGRVQEIIKDIDLMPLILRLAGIEYDGYNDGSSLYVNEEIEILGVTCNAEQVLMYSKFDNLKYIINIKTMYEELYDLEVDRHELHNLCDDDPVLCRSFQEIILKEIKENDLIHSFVSSSCVEGTHDKETQELLRAMGYIQ